MKNKASEKRLNKLLKLVDTDHVKRDNTTRQDEKHLLYIKPIFVRG